MQKYELLRGITIFIFLLYLVIICVLVTNYVKILYHYVGRIHFST